MPNLTDVQELRAEGMGRPRGIGELGRGFGTIITDLGRAVPPNINRRIANGITYFSADIGKVILFGSYEPDRLEETIILAELGADFLNTGTGEYDEGPFCSASGSPEEFEQEFAKLNKIDQAILESTLEVALSDILR
jgi:hypothetical protein